MQKLTPWQERLNDYELMLVRTFWHRLSKSEREFRSTVFARETDRDIFWGFLDDGLWAKFRRWFYNNFIHWYLRQR